MHVLTPLVCAHVLFCFVRHKGITDLWLLWGFLKFIVIFPPAIEVLEVISCLASFFFL